MSVPPPDPIELPQHSEEELAEIREVVAQVRRGDFSNTVPWDEIAADLGLL